MLEMYVAELLITKEQVPREDWQQLIAVLSKHVKGIKPFTLVLTFQENLVRYFVVSKKDITQLSSGVEGLLVVPAPEKDVEKLEKPANAGRAGFLKIPTGGNFFDMRERYKVQEGREITAIYLEIRRVGERYMPKLQVFFGKGAKTQVASRTLTMLPAHLLEADFLANNSYIVKSPPKYLSIEKTLHVLNSENINGLFSVSTFPYLAHDYYLNLSSFEFDKHSFIIGSSGSGKSMFISLFIDRLQRQSNSMNYRVIVIDPHASLEDNLSAIPSTKIVNFSGEGAQLFPDASADLSAATELTTTLFKSLMGEQFTPRLERVVRFSLFVLLTAQNMSFNTLKRFLLEIELRNQILEHVQPYVPQNIIMFFNADFNEIRSKYYNEAITPIISMIDEMQMQPTLVGENESSLAKTIQENFLTVFSLNKVSMGEKVVKTVAGLLIQQIFLLAQARAFNEKVLLFIDEVSVVQNPALASILAEARKFNLSVILTQQYFGQIDKDLRDAILSNVINYYVFKVSEEDARALEGNLNIELPMELIKQEKEKGQKETDLRVKLLTELHPQECIVRVAAQGQILPCIKAKTLDAPHKASAVNAEDLKQYNQEKLPPKFAMPIMGVAGHPAAQQAVPAPALATLPTAPAPEAATSAVDPTAMGAAVIMAQNTAHSMPVEDNKPMNLSELLAQHSSSRLKRKRKGAK